MLDLISLFWTPCTPKLIACGIVFVVAFFIYSTWNFGFFTQMGIPGPKPLPFLGTSHLYSKDGIRHDLELKAKFGRTFGVFEGANPLLVTSDLDLIKQIGIKDFESFSNHRIYFINKSLRSSIGNMRGEKWKAARAAALRAFNAAKLKKITPLIDDRAKALTQNMSAYAIKGEMFDVQKLCKHYTMDVIARTQFATQLNLTDPNNPFPLHAQRMADAATSFRFRILINMLFRHLVPLVEYFDICSTYPADSVRFFRGLVEQIILQRTKSTTQSHSDFLQIILDNCRQNNNNQDGKRDDVANECRRAKNIGNENWVKNKEILTDGEIVGSSVMFLVAGLETTSITVALTIYRLALNPRVQARLYEEVKQYSDTEKDISYEGVMKLRYLDQVLNEVMRVHPIPARTDRMCNETCQVGPYRIPKGTSVQFSILGVHYDEEYWPEPYKFDPDRFSPENRYKIVPNSLMPFGIGLRICLGMRLAVLQTKIALVRLVSEYEFFRCEKTEDPMTYKKHIFNLPSNGVWLLLKRRKPA